MFACRIVGRGILSRQHLTPYFQMAKRKASALATVVTESAPPLPPPKRPARRKTNPIATNPDVNADVLDGPQALRASPDAEAKSERFAIENVDNFVKARIKEEEIGIPFVRQSSDSSLSDAPEIESPVKAKPKTNGKAKGQGVKSEKVAKSDATPASTPVSTPASTPAKKEPQNLDPEADGEEEADEAEIQAASQRPPAVNSDYLPLPWKGRLGYVRIQAFAHHPDSLLTVNRHVSTPTYVSRTLRCLHHERAE